MIPGCSGKSAEGCIRNNDRQHLVTAKDPGPKTLTESQHVECTYWLKRHKLSAPSLMRDASLEGIPKVQPDSCVCVRMSYGAMLTHESAVVSSCHQLSPTHDPTGTT
eukprot:1060738-Amphidinium_carterae.1